MALPRDGRTLTGVVDEIAQLPGFRPVAALASRPVPTAAELTTFIDTIEGNPWVRGAPPAETVEICPPDPAWPARYAGLAADLRAVLGPAALWVAHVGSTSVPDLAAKPVIDIDLVVDDPAVEGAYVPLLAPLGYWHALRTPGWYEHRLLRLEQPRVNLHVWGPDCPEVARHLLLRDWLRAHPEDRRSYEAAKQAAALGGGDVETYNGRKQPVVREIYARAFAAAGLL